MIEHLTLCETKQELTQLRDVLAGKPTVSFDTETTGLDPWAPDAAFTMFQLTICDGPHEGENWVVPLDHPQSPFTASHAHVARLVAQWLRGCPLVLQNAAFDFTWVRVHTGIDLTTNRLWDTMVASHLLKPHDRASTSLKEVAPDVLGIPRWDDGMKAEFAKPGASKNVPMDNLATYGAMDTWATYKLAQHQREHLFLDVDYEPVTRDEYERARLGELAEVIAMNTVKAVSRLRYQGMPVDMDLVKRMRKDEQDVYEEAMNTFAGTYDVELWEGPKKNPRKVEPTIAATSKYFKAWMDQAVQKGDAKVLARTRTGQPQWDRHVLGKLVRAGSNTMEPVLEARKALKRNEYLGSMAKWAKDNVVHPSYRPGTLATGRLSASDPNPMQWESALKPAIKAPKGFVVLNTDYSQIELRVLAHVAGVPAMAAAYRSGQDLHKLTASFVAHVPLDEVTKTQRQAAKASNFGLAFGQGAVSFRDYAEQSYGVEMTLEEAEELHAKWFNAYPEVADWHADVKDRLYKHRQIVSASGRIRRFPRPWKEDENAAINFGVQSLAGDLMQLALYDLTTNGPQFGIHPITAVHDSIVTLVPEDNWEQCAETVGDSMTHRAVKSLEILMGQEFAVPIEVEHEAGTRWGLTDISHPQEGS